MTNEVRILIEELERKQLLISKLNALLNTNPKPIIWNGTLIDLVYFIDSLKANHYIGATDKELSKLFVYANKQVTTIQIQKARNRINDYKEPDYKPSETITQLSINRTILT